MRSLLSKAVLAFALTTVAACAADNTLGTWKLNAAKSKMAGNPSPLKNSTMVREASDGEVKVTINGERTDGTQVNASYTAKYDGTPSTINGTGFAYDTISIKQVNANTLTDERTKTGGTYHATGRTVVSNGGKTLTLTLKGKNAEGKEFTSTVVFDSSR